MPILDELFEKPIITNGAIGDILKPKPPPKDQLVTLFGDKYKRITDVQTT